MHPDCILSPFSLNKVQPEELILCLEISPHQSIEIACHVAHTLKDEVLGQEYVGASFAYIDNRIKRIIEKIIISSSG